MKIIIFFIIIFLNIMINSGCWNYREVDQMSIVAGVAIDKGHGDNLLLTVEIVEFTTEKDSKTVSKVISIEGKTIFDTARNGISYLGKKLYWGHSKVVIISEEVAKEGVIKILDWINRDSETRADVKVLISRDNYGKDILESTAGKNEIKSFELREIIDNQKNLSKAPQIDLRQFTNDLMSSGTVAIAPTIKHERVNGKYLPRVNGTSIFKADKLVGFLNEDETKAMLFVQNKLEGGVIVEMEGNKDKIQPMSLEIFKNKTAVKPVVQDGNYKFNIYINTITAIDEIGGTIDFIEENNRKQLELSTANNIKTQIEMLIAKMQKEYGADIFGFGSKLMEDEPKEWQKVEKQWGNKFKEISAIVNVNVHIHNSAMLSKPLEVGE